MTLNGLISNIYSYSKRLTVTKFPEHMEPKIKYLKSYY